MAAKAKSRTRPAAPPAEEAVAGPWLTPPRSNEERLERIAVMGQRVIAYIQFMAKIDSQTGTSAESRERALANFYDRLVVLERQLGQIQEDLRLG